MPDGDEADRNIGEIIKGLSREPAYLLAFGLALLLSGGAFASRATPGQAALVTAGAFALAGLSIVLVERRKRLSVPVQSVEQRARLSAVPEEEAAIRRVLEDLADNASDTYFVYSSTNVEAFTDYEGNRIEFPFSEDELEVTAIPDAHGIGKVHTMLNVAGKKERLHIVTSRTFRPEYWEADLILVGSRNANLQTDIALKRLGCPFRFNSEVSAIVETTEAGQSQWPERREALQEQDYALLAKLKGEAQGRQRVWLVLAGIGAMGTLAVCHYLQRHVIDLDRRFASSPFACVLSINRREGYTHVNEEKVRQLQTVQL